MLRKTLRRYLRPYAWLIAAVLLLKVLETAAALLLPTLNASIINRGVVTGDTGTIWRLGAQMLAITALQGAAAVAGTYVASRSAMGLGRDMRADIFGHVQRFNVEEISRFGAPSLITRSTNDIQQVQSVVFMISSMMLMAPIMLVGGTVMALRVDVPLSGLLVVLVPLLAAVVGLIASRLLPDFRIQQSRIDRVNLVMREQIQGMRVIRAFVRSAQRREVFEEANSRLTATSWSIGKLMALMFPVVQLIMNLASVAVIWFGGMRVDSGGMSIGDLTAYLNYITQILFSVMIAVMLVSMLPRAQVAAGRFQEVMALQPSITAPEHPARLPEAPDGADQGPGRGPAGGRGRRIELDDVALRYPGADSCALRGISLDIAPGTTTALIGSTGSGKSTLVNLLPRLLDVSHGSVRIDGVDVRDLDPRELRRAIATVPQKAYLFSGTIRSTLQRGGPDTDDAELWRALEAAQAAGFVQALDDGLDHGVDAGGVNFSGGQRQRLAIARALLRPAGVYIFDDSFSALDYTTDARLRAGLGRATGGATIIIVAQRVASIRDADQIAVLDKGRVVGLGTHEELMEGCPTYQEIVLSQISAEEAA
ncbi:ABC transporter ATP-binding protein [Actinomyces massiliensis]|uniref:ABC transporter transmembrane region n=1 Tax=Actinomyces massiliensis F0489 TaxID=1125718 RepID=J1GUQ5_9ACTO|nr:ABC transporter ATP-binding protein [Actinomyces massiliensis]EJF36795.1 ABC transporter transmembrane region [Actinomyces massiliensis F0489]WLD72993.1 ABC transporter ATP-binding protein [Actinomyces massiliensis]